MEELYSRLAPVWNTALTVTGFKRGLCDYVIKTLEEFEGHELKVLDVGCGTGLLSFAVLKNFPNAEVVATDLNEEMVKETELLARHKGVDRDRLTVGVANVLDQDQVKLSNGKNYHLKPSSFDVVIASGVLEYTPLEPALKKLLGITKTGGLLIIVSVKDDPVGNLWGKIYKFKPLKEEDIEDSLVRSGCSFVKKKPLTLKDFPANVTRTGHLAIK